MSARDPRAWPRGWPRHYKHPDDIGLAGVVALGCFTLCWGVAVLSLLLSLLLYVLR